MSIGICFEEACDELTDHDHLFCEKHESDYKAKCKVVGDHNGTLIAGKNTDGVEG